MTENISGNGCVVEENARVENGVEGEVIVDFFGLRFGLISGRTGLRTNSTPDLGSRDSIFVLELRLWLGELLDLQLL